MNVLDESLNTLTQGTLKYWPILGSLLAFILAQLVSYVKLKMHVGGLLKSINNVGMKVRDVEKKVDEAELEQILRVSDIQQRIAHIEGLLEGLYKPKQKNGQA